ncbi:MAG: ABC transporter ATP-binding protein/permease [Eubacterium sp.]|nr:ABC transporter ATP-binding protein/permease [Candidatus Colimonas fimequi]
MLKLKQLDKTFNKGKKNQIHVINNTTLQMDDTGLVALLGPSGCGKTTLLNVIGGLDAPARGDVFINGEKLTGRTAGAVDKIRSLNIGYIFQDYNLVENLTVYENIAIALRMIGIRNEDEIEEKVNYVLHKTGMYRFRNRLAEMLSGGERQRVGIARAIVKNPAIIIADEPTGNLDSKNTIEIMNIIKTISKEKLVILVTHEEELADFYATRIIRLLDGKVVADNGNNGSDGLDYKMDHKIYLKDIGDHKRLRNEQLDLNFYNDSSDKLQLDIVIKDGSIFIRNNNPNSRIEIIDDDSPIEFVDAHYKKLSSGDETETGFELSKLQSGAPKKYSSIIGPIRMLRDGYRRVGDYGIIKKILLAGFVISAMFVTYGISSIFGTLNVTDDMFVEMDKAYLSITSKNTSAEDFDAIEANEYVEYALPGNSVVNLKLKYDSYLQTSLADVRINCSLSDVNKLKDADILYGRLPEGPNEIVIDQMAIKKTIKELNTKELGLGGVSEYLGCNIEVRNMDDFTIVGISDCQSPCVYTEPDLFINILANNADEMELSSDNQVKFLDYKLMKDAELKKGEWPKHPYEVVVNEMNKDDMKIGKTIKNKIGDTKLKVVGYFSDGQDSDVLLVNKTTLKYYLADMLDGVTVCPTDKGAALKSLREQDMNVKDSYEQSKTNYIKEKAAYTRASLILAIVILAISCIEIFIIMRASFLSRIREVGVYRAIGMKKGDIYRMFIGEILVITTFTSLPGFIGMFYVLTRLVEMSYFENMYVTAPYVAAICLAVIYGINLLFGLIPVFRTIRKKPAQILSRTDI